MAYRFNPFTGNLDYYQVGGGASSGFVNSTTTYANYAALIAATLTPNSLNYVIASQGTSWLPGSLGGTYYPSGWYYYDGSTYSYQQSPFQATQAQVNAGTDTSTFVTPATLVAYLTAESDTLNSVLNRGNTSTLAITAGNIRSGSVGVSGQYSMYSHISAGVDWIVSLNPNVETSANANFYLPAQLPSSTYLINMTSAGVMGFDTTTYNSGSGLIGQSAFYSATNTITGDNNFFWDNTNKRLGIGTTTPTSQLTQKTSATTESVNVGNEITNTTPANWTTTNWTTSDYLTFTHVTTHVNALSFAMTTSAGQWYQYSFTVSGRTAGSFTITVGNVASGSLYSTTATTYVYATGNSNLIFTPSTDFDGTITAISVKQLTAYTPIYAINDSVGNNSLELRTGLTTNGNLFFGKAAGQFNIDAVGLKNTIVGNLAFQNNTQGYQNSALGYQSLYSNTNGNYNSALGYQSLYTNSTGYNNTALGYQSMYFNTNNHNNTAIGYQAIYSNGGTYNTAIGVQALYSTVFTNNIVPTCNTAIGYQAMNKSTNGSYNSALGYQSLYNNSTGYNNTAIGYYSSIHITTGYNNTSVGYRSLNTNTNSIFNVANGAYSLYTSNTTYGNIITTFTNWAGNISAIADNGSGTVKATITGGFPTAGTVANITIAGTTDYNGTYTVTCVDNTHFVFTHAFGVTRSGTWTSGQTLVTSSAATGLTSGTSYIITISGTTSYNGILTAIGVASTTMAINTAFVANDGIGVWASDAYYNTALGSYSGYTLTTGYQNTMLGYGAGYNASQLATAYNSTAIGYNVYTTANNQVVIGNGTTLHGLGVVPTQYLSLDGQAARTIWMERNTTANTAGNNLILQAGGATSAATDKGGGILYLAPGLSTGTGFSSLRLQSLTRATSTSTADNTIEDRLIIPSYANLTNNSAVGLFDVSLPTLAMTGGEVVYSILSSDGTDMHSVSGVLMYDMVNKGGVYTTTFTNTMNTVPAVSNVGGTIVPTWSFVSGTNKVTVKVSVADSLTTTILRIKYVLHNNSGSTITQL